MSCGNGAFKQIVSLVDKFLLELHIFVVLSVVGIPGCSGSLCLSNESVNCSTRLTSSGVNY